MCGRIGKLRHRKRRRPAFKGGDRFDELVRVIAGKQEQLDVLGNELVICGLRQHAPVGTLDDDMGIDPAETKTGNAGECSSGLVEIHGMSDWVNAMIDLGKYRVWYFATYVRRDNTALQGFDGLEQAGEAGRRLGVSDVRLDRADWKRRSRILA